MNSITVKSCLAALKRMQKIFVVLLLMIAASYKCYGVPTQGVRYEYDKYNRVCSVTYTDPLFQTNKFHYSYLGQSQFITGYTNANGLVVSRTYERSRDLLTSVSNTWNGTLISAFTYQNNPLGQWISRTDSNEAGLQSTNAFNYNARRELTRVVMGENTYSYNYDAIGNRKSVVVNSHTNLFIANELNQYTHVGDKTLSYNADGNLVSDGCWAYQWNADNRLDIVADTTETNGSLRIENSYDSQKRRVRTVVKKLFGRRTDPPKTGTWVDEITHEYIWDRWNMAYERITDHASGDIAHKLYVWGLDLSGTLQGVGGVGGLLMETHVIGSSVKHYYAIADANGNITDYINAAGDVVAHYEYSPFGEIIRESGSMVNDFSFRYSSKYYDNEKSKNEYIKQIKAIARKYPRVTLIFHETKDEFANAVNNVNGAVRQGEECISHFYFYGHGSPGHLWLNFTYGGVDKETGDPVEQMTVSNKDLKAGFLLKQAFKKGCKAESWACNTSTVCNGNKPSFGETWHSYFGFGIQGVVGQTHYGPCYKSRCPWRKPKPPVLDPTTGIEIVTP